MVLSSPASPSKVSSLQNGDEARRSTCGFTKASNDQANPQRGGGDRATVIRVPRIFENRSMQFITTFSELKHQYLLTQPRKLVR